ncbi:MAG: polyribonucleotide nucleotidyltransferase [Candidatus Daviesbacteria bacterium]|nr:polyribonucleotide nucleotidyltransferase [Candidatus Daviesbacteria bacterium]
MNKVITKELDLNGRKLILETGKLAKQADASVVATIGETIVLCTVSIKPLSEDKGYFPLSVEYVEKYYAGGRITGQKFIKRETRPTEEALLSGRAIDRAIRPLFPKDFNTHELQIIITVLSYDGINEPILAGFIGVSAALAISSVPFYGPIGTVRIGNKDGEFVINPEISELSKLDLNLLVASTTDKVVMIEAEGKEVADEMVFEGIKKAHAEAQKQIALIADFAKDCAKEKIVISPLPDTIESAVLKEVEKETKTKIEKALFDKTHAWHEATGDMIKAELATKYAENLTPDLVSGLFDKIAKKIMEETILEKGERVDGRKMDEVRPINIETGLLPRAHGSAVFERGTTQVLSIATLGPLSLAQTLEGMTGESLKTYIHHYNMSINPFSVGEVKKIGSPNRRDSGHGALAEKSIDGVLPEKEVFPYAIRVVSEVLAANASTSMASVCASSLALLNAGVPLKNPVAGIALGLLANDTKFQVITDMQAVEDFYGKMDFKVSGSVKGITAIQMDTKLQGLSFEIIEEALRQGKNAREFIIGEMQKAISTPAEISKYAPKIELTHIEPEEIGMLIGPGGKNINGIIGQTGAQVDVEDDGTVMVSSTNAESIKQALSMIEGMFKKVQIGEIYEGKVVRIVPFGAFVEILPGKDGLVHVSQMAPERVENPEDVVNEGQVVKVRVTDVDSQGKIALSMLFGNEQKPDTEGRPFGRAQGEPQRTGGFRPRTGGGERRGFGSGGFDRNRPGGRDRGGSRGGRGGFNR